jgi:murein DD-endopeptidase MepM/ murein hydrolase activator NlpD|tara:strand:- start:1499 stop:2440 length:942 start_codon:yes stop_codon:yes gene_type:complete
VKIILISNRAEKVRTLSLNSWAKGLLSVLLLGIPVATGTLLGVKIADGRWELLVENNISEMQHELVLQQQEVDSGRIEASRTLTAMTIKLAEMRSRLIRLDALGERLTQIARLEDGEFNFADTPGVGGPEGSPLQRSISSLNVQPELTAIFDKLDRKLDNRESQLQILTSMMSDNRLKKEQTVAGTPINKGWMSSSYGMRTDPFNGKERWHAGVDFAGKKGSEVIAVAAGVVTWSAKRSGYGDMVEINHGDGFVTRYGHNDENLVTLGSIVKKGQQIARMGSSGRSTGPHVHFEVYKNGRTVDPASYIHKTHR